MGFHYCSTLSFVFPGSSRPKNRRSRASFDEELTSTSNASLEVEAGRPFHQAEFVALKSEIADLVKTTAANFQYAAVGSAGMFTGLISTGIKKDEFPFITINSSYAHFALWLPFILTALFAAITGALYIRISEIWRYLCILEKALGSSPLGWEKRFGKHAATLAPIYGIAWAVLLLGDFFLALVLPGSPTQGGGR
jgi:hypothetical protein